VLTTLAWAICDVAAGVLAVAGVMKFFDPRSWVSAVAALGVAPAPRGARRWVAMARAVGVAEVGLAVAVLAGAPLTPWLLGVAYLSFSLVAALASARGGVSCGCFGARSAPITFVHVALNSVATVAAFGAGFAGRSSLAGRLGPGAGAALLYCVFLVMAVSVAVVTMTAGAELVAVRRAVSDRPPSTRAVAHR